MPNRTSTLLAVLLIGALALTTSCKEGSFLERRADNFKAHYNRYYNANDSFKRGLNSFEEAKIQIDLQRYLNIYRVPELGSGRDFDKVITKCAEILRKHPRSKWVDNSLLLIGKAYFFKNNFVGAEQKFNEVIRSESPLRDEARFWLGRTLVAAEASDDAVAHLEESLAGEIDKKWRPQLNLLIADLYAQDGEWEKSLEKIDAGMDGAKDDETAGRAQFLKGQILETLGRYQEAADAFHRVRKYKPLYELAYAAQYSRARITGLYIDSEQGLKLVSKMAKDDKHFDNLDHIDFAEAQIYQEKKDGEAALAIYLDMLYPDPAIRRPVSGDLKGKVHYSLGELHRDLSKDYVLASMYFDTSATVLRLPPEADQLYTTQAVHDFKDNADVFKRFREVAVNIERMDSLLFLGTLTDQEFEDELVRIQEVRQIAARRKRDDIERRRAEAGFGGGGGVSQLGGSGRSPKASGESNGFLDHRSEDRIRQGFQQFRTTWGERPLVHDWRREEAVAQAVAEVESSEELDSVTEALELGLAPLDPTAVPRDSLSLSKMLTERANSRYELGNVLFLALNKPDSALTWYQKVIEEDGEEEVALRALYATAEASEATGDTETAANIFRQIVSDFSDSEFDNRAREKLGLELNKVVRDSMLLAQASYSEAYNVWQQGDLKTAGENMLLTAYEYHTTDVAAQALFASGLIYTELAKREIDEFDYLDPIPIRDDLFSEEAHSAAKLAKEEAEAKEKERERLAEERKRAVEERAAEETASTELLVKQSRLNTIIAEISRMEQELLIRRRSLQSIDEEAENYENLNIEVTRLEVEIAAKKVELKNEEMGNVESIQSSSEPEEQDKAARGKEEIASQKKTTEEPVTSAEGPATREQSSEPKDQGLNPNNQLLESDTQLGDPSIQVPEAAKEPEIEPDYFLREIIPQPFRLIDVYKSVEANFDKTDFAKGARYHREAIEEEIAEKQAIIDSLEALEVARVQAIKDELKAEEEAKRLAENPPDSTNTEEGLAIPPIDSLAIEGPSVIADASKQNLPELAEEGLEGIASSSKEKSSPQGPVLDEEEGNGLSGRTKNQDSQNILEKPSEGEAPSTQVQLLPRGISQQELDMAKLNPDSDQRIENESQEDYRNRMLERMKAQARGTVKEKVEEILVYTIKKYGSRTSAKRAYDKYAGDFDNLRVIGRVLQGTRIFYLSSPIYQSEDEASFFEKDLLPSDLRDNVRLEKFPKKAITEYDFKPKEKVDPPVPSPEEKEEISAETKIEEQIPSVITVLEEKDPTGENEREGLPAFKKGYAVVVSSLPDYKSASIARKALLAKGLDAAVIPSKNDGVVIYRVAAFVSENRAEANAFLRENKGKTIPENAWVTEFNIEEELSRAAETLLDTEPKINQLPSEPVKKEVDPVEESKPNSSEVQPRPNSKSELDAIEAQEEPTTEVESLPEGIVEEPRRSIGELEAALDSEETTQEDSSESTTVVSNLQSGYAIIVSSKNEMTEAFQVLNDLRGRGYTPEIIPATINGNKIFRVAAALYATQDEAIDALNAGRGATLPSDAWISEFDRAAYPGQ